MSIWKESILRSQGKSIRKEDRFNNYTIKFIGIVDKKDDLKNIHPHTGDTVYVLNESTHYVYAYGNWEEL